MRALLIATTTILFLAASAGADDFSGHPPTDALNGATAFTLNRGEWQISSLQFFIDFPQVGSPFNLSQLKWLNVEYGLTNRLQIGTTVLENVLEGPNAWAKFNALRTRTLTLAVPLAVDVNLSTGTAGVGSGLALSWAPTYRTLWHTGLNFWAYDGQVQLSRIHTALEFALWGHTHLFVEADVWPLVVEVGSLSRFRALNLEVSSRVVEDTDVTFDIELELFLRF